MFQIVILSTIIAVSVSKPFYTHGMGYGAVGTSSVSVSRRTDVIAPAVYGTGIMGAPGLMHTGIIGTPAVISTSGIYGTRSVLSPLVEEETVSTTRVEKQPVGVDSTGMVENSVMAKTVAAPTGDSTNLEGSINSGGETVIGEQTVVEERVDSLGDAEIVSTTTKELVETSQSDSPIGKIRSFGAPGMVSSGVKGGVGVGVGVSQVRTDVVTPGFGGVVESSSGQTVVSSPYGTKSVSTFQKETDRIL